MTRHSGTLLERGMTGYTEVPGKGGMTGHAGDLRQKSDVRCRSHKKHIVNEYAENLLRSPVVRSRFFLL